MTIEEYIKKREEVLDAQLDKLMSLDRAPLGALIPLNAEIAELERIKMALEDGGLRNDSN